MLVSKTFAFSKIQKTTQNIENDINEFLKKHEFKFATQNESSLRGKFIVTIVGIKGKSSVRCQVYKDQYPSKLDDKVNAFLAKSGMKFMTQTFVGSSIYTVVFYDSKAADGDTTTTTDTTANGTN